VIFVFEDSEEGLIPNIPMFKSKEKQFIVIIWVTVFMRNGLKANL
jgi:hypothetical protein